VPLLCVHHHIFFDEFNIHRVFQDSWNIQILDTYSYSKLIIPSTFGTSIYTVVIFIRGDWSYCTQSYSASS
jgi:hypothetical protein